MGKFLRFLCAYLLYYHYYKMLIFNSELNVSVYQQEILEKMYLIFKYLKEYINVFL